ncbi:Alkaline phosphatase synthesis sensor protein PhoR [Aquimixticola soesokkakensis]|uniref:histidine kinase n=1 Tax=Aquimixticola soesokkakensis TaxID=1519096 RepID=A0A1Y5SLX9_9RHOB|nr:ATP-binding protein [Aquimixticola soesokkakensis]SLN40704.1 Alkaline phosphatase synthesis sensor protein PhoR [Aquimixticola soesokkakensis]
MPSDTISSNSAHASAQSLVAAVPLPALAISIDERIAAANARAEELLENIGQGRPYITALRQPMLLDVIEAALRIGQAGEASFRKADGARDMSFRAHVTPLSLSDFKGVLVCFEDETPLQEAGQMRRDFVANVSHELRTPLTAMMGFIETLRGPARDDAGARDRFLGIMDREAHRMNRLVGDLLSLSRVESEERMRPTEAVDIAGSLRACISTLRPQAEARGVTIRMEGCDDSAVVPGDSHQLVQVFTNLIENAIKYGRKDSEVSVCITNHVLEPTLRGAALRIDIADQGEGISPVHIPRLTERFYRVDSHRSREMGGTGLGLAIVKHIVSRHRGRLRIESHAGQGSCFSVILPKE